MVVINDVIKQLNEVKVAKRKKHLFGVAGDIPPIEEVIKWYFSGRKKKLKNYEFILLVIEPSGTINEYDNQGRENRIQGPFYAIGSGKEYAIGAMVHGATSEQAVQAAIDWCPTCGGKVIVRKL